MVLKSVLKYEPEALYICEVCNFPFKKRKDAAKCESLPVSDFKFAVGDKVGVGGGPAMVLRQYRRSSSPHCPYMGSMYEHADEGHGEWGDRHVNIYSVFVRPEILPKLAVRDPSIREERFLSGLVDARESEIRKLGSYDKEFVKYVNRLMPKLFSDKGLHEF